MNDLFPESVPPRREPKAKPPVSSVNGLIRNNLLLAAEAHREILVYSSDRKLFDAQTIRRAFGLSAEIAVTDIRDRHVESYSARPVHLLPGAIPPLPILKVLQHREMRIVDLPEAMLHQLSIRCLSLHQPWASLMKLRAKRWETRDWRAEWRGLIAIHAAKSEKSMGIARENAYFRSALSEIQHPFGKILGVGRLADVIPTERWLRTVFAARPTAEAGEYQFGNYNPERFAWSIPEFQSLPEDIHFSAQQGLFPLPQDAIDALTSQLPNLHRTPLIHAPLY